ncbi:hypothetical protein E3Q22_02259 [Wallemia mellicola]|uniref:COX assembly mitochondrial protein n=2 Tax=Wallemia mellicola TaxID=1708541 RepID=A0A4T0PUU3_9BASI|nr:hypothetical protein WALSEDRAFT_40231 [Wallemia mellicola CBS 633.66]TIB72798.1 hypothetical protein E3Q24_01482 [Wallemia mellicola]EIM20252.1 hypothetical protein WALSEDRAFT_40231 [Wallemia mellicola CBS 633.66]TIB77539.1 hypothetical protein E3Q23_01249 [Wallemia mellicola]TIB79891.1 hypothetical protein E3Q22_02259 [Wallemia mellicola]TIB86879.1 hypothetical protein E3Q21_01503 [Wallemia mellicola]|eukprot:XP_006959740.1 hypothetical protein WALSEDRAFT_40231 [Wallemia mellicola CBS 633.66]
MRILSRREDEEIVKQHKQLGLQHCHHLVQQFAECTTNRTISVLWACRKPHKELNSCLAQFNSEEALDAAKEEYLKKRDF